MAGGSIDAELAEHAFHAEGAGFVGHDRDDVLAEITIAHESTEHSDEPHGGRGFAVAGAFVELGERLVGRGGEVGFERATLGHVSAHGLCSRGDVVRLATVSGRTIERCADDLGVGERDGKSVAELQELLLV